MEPDQRSEARARRPVSNLRGETSSRFRKAWSPLSIVDDLVPIAVPLGLIGFGLLLAGRIFPRVQDWEDEVVELVKNKLRLTI